MRTNSLDQFEKHLRVLRYAKVTVYGNDTTDLTCSATILQFAEPTTCYNSSWIYLSIDNCANGTASASSPTVSSSTEVSVGGIVGGVVGGIAFIAAMAGGAWYLVVRRRRRRGKARAREEESKQQDDRGEEQASESVVRVQSHQVDDSGVYELQPDALRHEMEVNNSASEMSGEPKKIELDAAAVPVELEGHFP